MCKNQGGFSAVEALLILLIVGVLGTIGYLVYNKTKTKPVTQNKAAVQTTGTATSGSNEQAVYDSTSNNDKIKISTVNALQSFSEAYYITNSYYPLPSQIESAQWVQTNFKGFDIPTSSDPKWTTINNGGITYKGINCNSNGCASFKLSIPISGSTYEKVSQH